MARHRLIGAQRDRAERYLVITIAAFAVTVAGTRFYLDVSGYPTVGGGELHVAHVLWGGLALFLAALLPLLFAGRRSLTLSALLAGVGVGLFIDEVGKFLTTSNDYFFAPAAPIIYGSILLLVLLWVLIRRRRPSRYDASWALLEALGAGLDGQLTAADRERVVEQVKIADTDADGAADPLSDALVTVLEAPDMSDRLGAEGWVARGDARRLLERLLPTRIERWLVIASLVLATIAAIVSAAVILYGNDAIIGELIAVDDATGRLEIPTEPVWVLLTLGIQVVTGFAAVAALVLMARGQARRAMDAAMLAMVTYLVAGGLVSFYAAQFTVLSSTISSVLLLGLIVDLRIRLQRDDVDEPDAAVGAEEPTAIDEATG